MTEESGILEDRETLFPVTLSIRLTNEINDELPRIASFENTKVSALCRQELLKMLRRYQRNPQYKSWLKRTEKAFSRENSDIKGEPHHG